MRTVTVDLAGRSYPIYIGRGVARDAARLGGSVCGRQVFVVSNETVAPLYLDDLCAALADRELTTCIVPDGEAQKSLEQFAALLDRMVETRQHRDTTVVALGGGVVGDLAGFVAACYQRGVAFVQVPTTLLAQVDSSVGGKTAVNHPLAKNMIGAFHQPRAVFADPELLSSLSRRQVVAGIAEIIKYGVIADAALFAWLEANIDALLSLDPGALEHAIARSCEIKAEIVARDERESGVRAHLNFGHTFAHAIESAEGYGDWLHGEAVGVGMVLAAELSVLEVGLAARDAARIRTLLERAGLPTVTGEVDVAALLEAMTLDKKVAGGRPRFVLTREIGSAELCDVVPPERVEHVLQAGR